MKNHPIQVLVLHPGRGALIALMMLGSLVMLRAATNSADMAPLSLVGDTNAAPQPAVTPALPTPPVPPVPPSTPGISVTTDDDDATPDAKSQGHGKSYNINIGHEAAESVLEAVLIPIVAITATFGTPVLIVFFVCYFKYRRRRENMAMAREFLSKGLPVPPQLLDESLAGEVTPSPTGVPSRGRSDLRKGLNLTFIGLAISLALFVNDPHSTTWSWGLIPLIIGNGLAISGWIELRHQRLAEKSAATNPPPPSNHPL